MNADKYKMAVWMRYVILLLTVLFLYGDPSAVRAEDVLRWEDCVNEARENHPDLISAFERVNQAGSDKDIVLSDMLPQVTAQAAGKKSKTSSGNKANSYSYSVAAKQLLFDGFKTFKDINAAAENAAAEEYNFAVTSSNVRLNLRNAFASLLRAQDLTDLTKEIAERREQNLGLVRLRYDAGREHKGSLLTAEADFAQAGFEVAQAERNLSLSMRELTKELGRERLIPVKVEGNFSIKETDRDNPDFEYLADFTPFLKELIAKKEAARFNYLSAKADFFPQVYLNTSYGESAPHWPADKEDWSAGVTVSFSLFEGGSRIARVSKTKSGFKQARAEERSGRDTVVFTLEQAWKNFQDAIDTAAVRKKFLEAAEERARIASSQYSAGLVSFDDWVIIEDNLVSTKKSFLDARANLLSFEADWVQAKGGTLEYDER
jgi:outer membrane protein TolC